MKNIGIVGSRALPERFRSHVRQVVELLLEKGHCVNSGGAVGADSFALESLLALGAAKRGTIFSAWTGFVGFPFSVKQHISEFAKRGGRIIWGDARPHSGRQEIVSGLLGRNRRLVENSDAIVAYLCGESRGTMYTIREAVKKGIPVTVFVCDEKAELINLDFGKIKKVSLLAFEGNLSSVK